MNAADIAIFTVNSTSPQFQQVWDLREEVLRKPLGMSLKNDDTSRDFIDTIFVAEYNGKVIGCVFFHHIDAATVQLRQMAVDPQWQGKGIGRLLVKAGEQYAREKGYQKIMLHARKYAAAFYTVMDYQVVGDEFTEVGIPHFMMEKELN
jgi:predicted N-acetyltransferase YhbS